MAHPCPSSVGLPSPLLSLVPSPQHKLLFGFCHCVNCQADNNCVIMQAPQGGGGANGLHPGSQWEGNSAWPSCATSPDFHHHKPGRQFALWRQPSRLQLESIWMQFISAVVRGQAKHIRSCKLRSSLCATISKRVLLLPLCLPRHSTSWFTAPNLDFCPSQILHVPLAHTFLPILLLADEEREKSLPSSVKEKEAEKSNPVHMAI